MPVAAIGIAFQESTRFAIQAANASMLWLQEIALGDSYQKIISTKAIVPR